MPGPMKVNLRAGELIYVNGAAIRTDRHVTLAIENAAAFLLARHAIAADEAITPLMRHYITVQALLIEPGRHAELIEAYAVSHRLVAAAYAGTDSATELNEADRNVCAGRPFDALKILRRLFDRESCGGAGADAARNEAEGTRSTSDGKDADAAPDAPTPTRATAARRASVRGTP